MFMFFRHLNKPITTEVLEFDIKSSIVLSKRLDRREEILIKVQQQSIKLQTINVCNLFCVLHCTNHSTHELAPGLALCIDMLVFCP